MATLTWVEHGGNLMADGDLGQYRIGRTVGPLGEFFSVQLDRKDGTTKGLGGSNAIKNAKAMAQTYDGYRAPKTYRIAGMDFSA